MSSKAQTSDSSSAETFAGAARHTSNTWRIILAIGDIVVFFIFAITGIRSHDEQLSISRLLITVAPFIVAWFIVSPLLGAFRREVETSPKKMLLRTLLAWVVTWPVALLFRGLIEWKFPPLSFALVTLITNAVLLVIWRELFAFIAARLRPRS
jgi:hypothetical protein